MALVDELVLWAEEQAARERRAGFEAQMQGNHVLAATHIGREWAFYNVMARARQLQIKEMHSVRHDRWQDADFERALAENDEQRDYAEERFNEQLMREE